MTPKDDESAFPCALDQTIGMSLRDWFAGQALAGLVIDTPVIEIDVRRAYQYADAMLTERAKDAK
jgi:hypothetical protein